MMATFPRLVTKDNVKQFLESFDTILTDCDGVLWTGGDVIGQANKTLNQLQAAGKKVFYVTNNSTETREGYMARCHQLDFKATKEDILSPSYVLAQYLKQQNFKKKVYIIGTSGMSQELEAEGIAYLRPEAEAHKGDGFLSLFENFQLDPEVGAVAVGLDPHFSFPKIMRAVSYLERPNCLFLATNMDEHFPFPRQNLVFPGAGCLVRCVETGAERPATVMGKPSTKMFSVLQESHHVDPKRTLMIGDRGNTDILFGKNCGMHTLVVLSGVTQMPDLERWVASTDPADHSLLADYYLPQLDHLLPLLA